MRSAWVKKKDYGGHHYVWEHGNYVGRYEIPAKPYKMGELQQECQGMKMN